MNRAQLELVLEALKSAQTELEALEDTVDFYCTTGNLIEQIVDAIDIVEQELP